MPILIEQNESAEPLENAILGPNGIMKNPQVLPNLIQRLRFGV